MYILKSEWRKKEMKKQFRSFEEAREFVRKLNFKNEKTWRQYLKSGNKPEDIPTHPARSYKNKGWVSLGDWFGTNRIAAQYQKFKSFENARKFVRTLGIHDDSTWRQYCRSGNKPKDIPSAPWNTYKNKGWVSLGDWFGTNQIASQKKSFRDFEKSKEFVHSLHLKSQKEWQNFSKSGNRPLDIPSLPNQSYDREWISWGDWLGTENVATQIIESKYISFNDAREIVRKLAKKYNIKTKDDWISAKKSGKIPTNIPLQPWRAYNKKRIMRKNKIKT